MGLVLATTAGFVAWVVLWALGWKPFDAFMITLVILALAGTRKILAPYLPGRR